MTENTRTNALKNVVYDLSRINEWWLLSLGMVFFAYIPYIYVQNDGAISIAILMELFGTPSIYIALLTVFAAQVFLFASNDYFDRHIDCLDPHKKNRNPVCNGNVTLPGVRALLVVSCIIPLAASLYFGIWTFLYACLAMFVFYFYTAPPVRMKNKVGLDVLSHALFINTFPYLFCLVALNDFSPGTIFLLAVIMMRSAMAQMFQEIRDYEVDRQVEINTVVALGQRRALRVIFGIYIAMFIMTTGLLMNYQLGGWGIELYYIIILILWFTYLPVFHRLMRSDDLGSSIERLWMGQGRTNRWQVVQYFCSFAIYFALVLAFRSSGML